MGAPDQLTRAQVQALQHDANGAPVQQLVIKHAGGTFTREFPMHQNDIWLVMLNKL